MDRARAGGIVATVAEGVEALRQRVLDEWERAGPEGARAALWALDPEDQIRVSIDLYNHRQLEPFLSGIHEHFEHDMRPTGIPGMETYSGPDGYRRFLGEWLDAFPDSQLEIETIEMEEDILFAAVRQEVSGAGSGVPVSFTYYSVAIFSDGRVASTEFYMDADAARARFAEMASASRA